MNNVIYFRGTRHKATGNLNKVHMSYILIIEWVFLFKQKWVYIWCTRLIHYWNDLWYMMTSSNGNVFRVTGSLWGGIQRSPVDSPHKSQWRRALMFSLICAWINGWANNRNAGDFRRHRVYYYVTVMFIESAGQGNLYLTHRLSQTSWN